MNNHSKLDSSFTRHADPHHRSFNPVTFYLRHYQKIYRDKVDKDGFKGSMVDIIDKEIVAKVDCKRIADQAPNCVSNALFIMQPPSSSEDSNAKKLVVVLDEQDRKLLAEEKGVPRSREREEFIVLRSKVIPDLNVPVAMIQAPIGQALLMLKEESNLFRTAKQEDIAKIKATAGAFFVAKANGMLRVIVDARWGNIWFNPHHRLFRSSEGIYTYDHDNGLSMFNLFSLEMLEVMFSNLSFTSAKGSFYAVHCDLRHWFHQLKIPDHLAFFYALRVYETLTSEDDAGKTSSNAKGHWLLPRAVPMGAIWGPLVGAAAALGIALNRDTYREEKNRIGSKYGISDETWANLETRSDLPRFVPLNDGGGIYVLIDNILVVTPNLKMATDWAKRLWFKTKEAKATLKEGDPLPGDVAPLNGSAASDYAGSWDPSRIHVTELSKENNASFCFAGVRWKFDGRQVANIPEGATTHVPGMNTANGTWEGSHLELASILGNMNWWMRVAGVKQFETSRRYLNEVYKHVTPPTQEEWSKSTSLTTEVTRILNDAWKRHRPVAATWNDYEKMSPLDKNHETVCIATDASQKGWAAVFLDSQTASVQAGQVIQRSMANQDEYIAIGELRAIVEAVNYLRDHHDAIYNKLVTTAVTNSIGLIVIATDSQTAQNWISNQSANNGEACDLLVKLFEVTSKEGWKLYLTYVHTSKNVADDPSRSFAESNAKEITNTFDVTELDSDKVRATCELLESARKEAVALWSHHGSNVGSATITTAAATNNTTTSASAATATSRSAIRRERED